MSEKNFLLDNLVEKSGRSREEISSLVTNKVNELSGLISEDGAMFIIANELGIRLESKKPVVKANEFLKVEEIKEPKIPVSLCVKVIRKYNKVNFSSENNSEGCVQSLLVGDETGVIRIVFWHDKTGILENLQEGDIIVVKNAYTRENNQNPGRLEIHYGQYSDIEVNPENVKIELKEFSQQGVDFTEKKISELNPSDRNVSISGIITDFEIPRFYLGCPECFKKVFQEEDKHRCAEHEEVEGQKIPIVNIIVDDGSGTINVVGFRDRAENMTKSTSAQIVEFTENIEKYKNFSKKIIGSKIKFGGNVGTNNMTGESQVLANQIFEIEFKDVETIAKELVSEKKESSNKKNDEDLDLEIEEIEIDEDLI